MPPCRSPHRSRICPLEELHLGQEMAEMLGMVSLPSALLHPAIGGPRQRRAHKESAGGPLPFWPEPRGINRDAIGDQHFRFDLDRKHLAGIGPELVHRILRAAVAFLRAVAEPDEPFA